MWRCASHPKARDPRFLEFLKLFLVMQCLLGLLGPVYNEYPLGATSIPLLLRSSPCSHISRACI